MRQKALLAHLQACDVLQGRGVDTECVRKRSWRIYNWACDVLQGRGENSGRVRKHFWHISKHSWHTHTHSRAQQAVLQECTHATEQSTRHNQRWSLHSPQTQHSTWLQHGHVSLQGRGAARAQQEMQGAGGHS